MHVFLQWGIFQQKISTRYPVFDENDTRFETKWKPCVFSLCWGIPTSFSKTPSFQMLWEHCFNLKKRYIVINWLWIYRSITALHKHFFTSGSYVWCGRFITSSGCVIPVSRTSRTSFRVSVLPFWTTFTSIIFAMAPVLAWWKRTNEKSLHNLNIKYPEWD